MKDYLKRLILLSGILAILATNCSSKETPKFLHYLNDPWVDSLMTKLTLEQKIGQLFMIQAYSNQKFQKTNELIDQIKEYQVGAIIFMQGGPVAQASITNKFQEASNIPLLIAIDGESGLGFRLDSTLNYPSQMALGALQNDSLIYRMGYEIGKQFRRVGLHMNLAPVCDINNNPANPVINFRSFGEDKYRVAKKAWLYASGLQDAGILATAKHFPGHGDTETDSHLRLPVINQTKTELDSIELYPFSYLIENGIGAVMTGHLQVPALEPNTRIPATLSGKIIRNKLQQDMGFNGLIITDAMNMSGAGKSSSGELVVKALKAGNDMVEIVPNLQSAISAVKMAVSSGELTKQEIDQKCRKILAVKKWLSLDKYKPAKTNDLSSFLNQSKFKLTKQLLFEQSLTVLENKEDILPLKNLDTYKIACLSIGSTDTSSFQKMLANYMQVDPFCLSKNATDTEITKVLNQLKPYNLIIAGINGMSMYPGKRFNITDQQIRIAELLDSTKTIGVFFGNPYALSNFPGLKTKRALVVAFQHDIVAEETAAQLIFGAIDANGKLPVSVKNMYPANSGITFTNIHRLKYSYPEEVGIDASFLEFKIDSIAQRGIKSKAFPGCEVLIAKNGKIIYNRSFGYLTYENKIPVRNDHIYDLASVTKVSAPLPAVMRLYDEKKIDLDAQYSKYFAEFKNSNKANISVRDVLTHQAGLQAFIPFYLEPGTRSTVRKGMFRNQPSEQYPIRVAKNLYARNDFEKIVISDIVKSPLNTKKEYVYSDLGMGMFRFVTERITGKSFPEYLNQEFYKPLGASSTGFKPYEKYPIGQIAPTEDDNYFRKELLQGFVHDEMAAVLGGVSGNAGLFSNANDLAKVMQMYLQLGYYGGKQFIAAETVKEFTKTQFPQTNNRRALGFDKPTPGNGKNKFPAADASAASYGHTGYTGTFVWMDPENQLLIVFLTNRVYPTRNQSAISDLNIRSAMHQTIYDAIKHGLNSY